MAPTSIKRSLSNTNLAEEIVEAHQIVADVPYLDDLEKLNSELEVAWKDSLNPHYLAKARAYDRVEVLMLAYWEKWSDMKGVNEEMNELDKVFKDIYGFNVTQKHIQHHEQKRKRPQAQINFIIANWVHEHEDEKTLLIVYYAGHGDRGDDEAPGKLFLNGRMQSQFDNKRYINSIDWTRTENNLLNIGSDVLQIFDTCFAGAAHGNRGGPSQICEYLAACDKETKTKAPGKNSFTSALIWALKDLSGQRFTTSLLTSRITDAPHFPEEQKPVLLKRRHDPNLHDNERLVLFSLKKNPRDDQSQGDTHVPPKLHHFRQGELSKEDVVTLKLVFASRPSAKDINALADGFGPLIQGNKLDISSVIWCGMEPRRDGSAVFHPVFHKAVARFKSLIHKELVDAVQEGVEKTIDEHLSKKPRLGGI